MAKFSVLDDQETDIEIPEGDILEIVPDDQLDSHAPDEGDQEAIEEIGDVTEGLEACMELYREAANGDSMSPLLAKSLSLNIALAGRDLAPPKGANSQSQAISMALQGRGRLGLEDWRDSPSSMAYGMEGLKEIGAYIVKIWEKMCKWVSELYMKVAAWFDGWISKAAFARRKADAIIAKVAANKVKGTLKNEEMKIGKNEFLALTRDGKTFNPIATIKDVITRTKEVTPEKTMGLVEKAIGDIEAISAAIKAAKKTGTENWFTDRMSAGGKTIFNSAKAQEDVSVVIGPVKPVASNDKGKAEYVSEEFSGGKRIKYEIKLRSISGEVMKCGQVASIEVLNKKLEGKDEVAGLNAAGITALATECKEAATTLQGLKNTYRVHSKAVSGLNSKIKTILSGIDKGVENAETTEAIDGIKASIGDIQGQLTAPFSVSQQMQSISLTAVNAGLQYCVRSMGHHEEK
jgi:hypothetical protein